MDLIHTTADSGLRASSPTGCEMPCSPSGEWHLTTGLPLYGKRAFVWSSLTEALHKGHSSCKGRGLGELDLRDAALRVNCDVISAPVAEKKLKDMG